MNKANLLKLAAYLESLPKDYANFEMCAFRGAWTGESQRTNLSRPADLKAFTPEECSLINTPTCGTAGCAIGHGPQAGFPMQPGENWFSYSERVSGLPRYSKEWEWCFSGEWSGIENTPQQAAARIRRLVETGEIGELPSIDEE